MDEQRVVVWVDRGALDMETRIGREMELRTQPEADAAFRHLVDADVRVVLLGADASFVVEDVATYAGVELASALPDDASGWLVTSDEGRCAAVRRHRGLRTILVGPTAPRPRPCAASVGPRGPGPRRCRPDHPRGGRDARCPRWPSPRWPIRHAGVLRCPSAAERWRFRTRPRTETGPPGSTISGRCSLVGSPSRGGWPPASDRRSRPSRPSLRTRSDGRRSASATVAWPPGVSRRSRRSPRSSRAP